MNHTLPVPREEDIIWKWNGYDTSQFTSSFDYDSVTGPFTGTFSMSIELDKTSEENLKEFCLKMSVTNSVGIKLWELTSFTQSRVAIFIEFTSSSIDLSNKDGWGTNGNAKFALVGITNGSGGVDGNGLLFHWNMKQSSRNGLSQLITGSLQIRRLAQNASSPYENGFCRLFFNKRPTDQDSFYRIYYFGNSISEQYTHNSYSVPTQWTTSSAVMNYACLGFYMTGSGLGHADLYIKSIYVTKHPFDIE